MIDLKDPFTKERLIEFRQLLEDALEGFPCQTCGLCCIIKGKICLEIEFKEIIEKFGSHNFDCETYPFPILKKKDLFCPFLYNQDSNHASNNLRLFASSKMVNNTDLSQISLSDKFYCKIYEERPIICRLYPQHPMNGVCVRNFSTKELDNEKKALLEDYFSCYSYNFDKEVLRSQIFDWSEFKPILSPAFIQLLDNSITHYCSVTDIVKPLWDNWWYHDRLELEKWEEQFINQINSKRSVKQIASDVNFSLEDSISFVQDLLIFRLIKVPSSIKLMTYSKFELIFQ